MTVIPRLLVGGQQMPTNVFSVTGGAYGSTGSLVAYSSLVAMEQAGVDVVALSIASPGSLDVDLYVSNDDPNSDTFGDTHMFSGEYLTGDFDYGEDILMVHARDWSGPLVDQKRALTTILNASAAEAPDEAATSGVSTQNRSLSNIVTQIAEQFSLIPDLRINQNISNADADVGTIFGNTTDTIMTATPQSLWGLLTQLARQSGNIVYVTPEKHLVFGEPGAGLEKLSLTWRQNGAGSIPLLKPFKITHNPRRNLTFRVMVLSYDPTMGQMTTGQAYVIGADYSTDDGGTVQAGAWGGSKVAQITKAIGTGRKTKKNAIQIYTFHIDGLTASQAQSRAESIAADIAKRELVATCRADVIPNISPGQQAMIAGKINQEFASHTYYVTGFTHQFRLAGDGASEFSTSFTMLDRQPEGQGMPVKDKAAKRTAVVG